MEKRRWTRFVTLLVVAALAGGCHGRYRKAADQLGSVRPAVGTPSEPRIGIAELAAGRSWGERSDDESVDAGEVVGLAMDVGIVVKAAAVESRLRSAVEPEQVASALEAAILGAPAGEALPHRLGRRGRHVMRVDVVDYGIDVSGGAPEIYSSISVSIDRRRDGKRLYRASTSCRERLQDVPSVPLVLVEKLASLYSLSQLESMGHDELAEATLHGVRRCGERVVERMSRHAR